MSVRGLMPSDYDWVAALGTANEVETGPIGGAWLEAMSREWFMGAAAGENEAFAIIFDQTANYTSPNFHWFRERYPRFVYVDRIVVSESARGKGLARALYEHVFAEARAAGHERVVCEINFDPPNPGSDAFHAKLGFSEMGRATLANCKSVRYLERLIGAT
jgi:predicted GNAT superfamily acetyltransferase